MSLIALLALSTAFQAIFSALDLTMYPPPGRLIDVGDHRLHLYCLGEGEPTIVMEAGMGGWSTDWALVQPAIAKTSRVCTYDRAGSGWSEAGPQPRDSKQVATELHTLLTNAGVDNRVILVGHSLGGLFTQYYAEMYPDLIAGLVLVDSVHRDQSQRMKKNVRRKYERGLRALTLTMRVLSPTGLLRLAAQPETIIADKLPSEYRPMARALGFQSKAYRTLDQEMAAFEQSQTEVQKAGPLPHVPLVVISSSSLQNFPPGFSGEYMEGLWDELQNELSEPATTPHIIAEDSGHYIQLDRPELVIQAVVDMENTIREQ